MAGVLLQPQQVLIQPPLQGQLPGQLPKEQVRVAHR